RVTADVGPTVTSLQLLALNTWYYVVATYDGTTAKLYINGKLDNSLSVTAVPKQTNDSLTIGRRPDGHFTNALIDEVAIYPTALSADRIAAHWRIASATR
ncbi:MAG TPA: LamG domain-containing protein, partial [Candidatus Limnocylindria bacterium]|nr:LamG domain-containing protein [Candidatus Limnocylindria bacterium]